MEKPKKIIVFLYNRLFDPVIQSNFWLFIREELKTPGENRFYVVSYEDDRFPLSETQLEYINQWKASGMRWYRLKWHSGLSLFAKIRDLLGGFLVVGWLKLMGCSKIISVASIAGSFVYLYSRILPMSRFVYCYEPHSEYARDNHIWSEKSYQFRILNALERRLVKNAKIVTSGTCFMEERIRNEWEFKRPLFRKIPTVVNDEKFTFNSKARQLIRRKYNISEECRVLFYPGKFGDLYYENEIPQIYKKIHDMIPNVHFLIVSPQPKEYIDNLFQQNDVDPSTYTITSANYEDIHTYFSAGDLGIVAVSPGPSKKFISNIKVGEYLCAGMPYLITEGVSEDYLYALEKKAGIVVKDFTLASILEKISQIDGFLNDQSDERRIYLRSIGVSYRGLSPLRETFSWCLNQL